MIVKKHLLLISASLFMFECCFALSELARSKGFVYLDEIDPSILVSLRYGTDENFVGKPVDGYKKSRVIVTKQTAEALQKVQKELKKDGYCLVVYDAYRPQQAVNHFIRWSEDTHDQLKKDHYYPHIDKANVFDLGYVGKRSGHSRGSTIDLTLIKAGKVPHPIQVKDRILKNNVVIKFLDDGTMDMGSSFDLFDSASHTENDRIDEQSKKNRAYLKNVMGKFGFKNYEKEWWHFTLIGEPHPANQDSSYFDFDIE